MLPETCRCPCCGRPLHICVGWARLVTVEPTVIDCRGTWGLEAIAVGGDAQVTIRCPACSTDCNVGRDVPLAAA